MGILELILNIIDICPEVDTSGLMLSPNILRQLVWLAFKSHVTVHIFRLLTRIDSFSTEYQTNCRQIAHQMFITHINGLNPTQIAEFMGHYNVYIQIFAYMYNIHTLLPFIIMC
jgi:hypothetical protein